MKTVKILGNVEYVGTKYFGWQSQGRSLLPTVSSVLLQSVKKTLGQPFYDGRVEITSFTGASRTDRGVHALSNAFEVTISRDMLPLNDFTRAINNNLAKQDERIRVFDLRYVPLQFKWMENVS